MNWIKLAKAAGFEDVCRVNTGSLRVLRDCLPLSARESKVNFRSVRTGMTGIE